MNWGSAYSRRTRARALRCATLERHAHRDVSGVAHRCTVPSDRTGTHSTVRAGGQADSQADTTRTADTRPETPRTAPYQRPDIPPLLPDSADKCPPRPRTPPTALRAPVR